MNTSDPSSFKVKVSSYATRAVENPTEWRICAEAVGGFGELWQSLGLLFAYPSSAWCVNNGASLALSLSLAPSLSPPVYSDAK